MDDFIRRYERAFQRKDTSSAQEPADKSSAAGTGNHAAEIASVIAEMRHAAVLVPVYEGDDGEINCLLTVRSLKLRSHPGEVCFPGGKVDESDGDVVQAALREAEEEVGLPPSSVRVLGCMPPTMSLHLLHVTPVVGVIPNDFQPTLNQEEVDAVFSLPLRVVLSPSKRQHHYDDLEWYIPWRMHTFSYNDRETWGLTAETLVRLCAKLYPDHPFPYDTRHPDGSDMDGWFDRAVRLPALHGAIREKAQAARRKRLTTKQESGSTVEG